MSVNLAAARTINLIMWHLRKGHSEEEAVAWASKREPDMTEAQLAWCLRAARGQMLACDRITVALAQRWDNAAAEAEGKERPHKVKLPNHKICDILDSAQCYRG